MSPKFIVFLSICTVLMLSACDVGKRELGDLALVMAVGIDKGNKEGMKKVTIQVVRPADARGQTGAPSGQTGDPIWSASAEGETIFHAIRNLSTFSSRRIFWAHNFIIVINEDLAREGIKDIIDFFTRNPELRMRTWVVVTPEKASTVVSTMTGLETVPGEAFDKLFRYTPISTQAPRTQMIDLQAAYLSESSEPILARALLINRGISNKKPGQAGSVDQIELAGAGVFKGDKLVGILKPVEVRRILPFIEPLDTGVLILKCPDDKDKKMTVELKNQKFNVKPSLKDKKPVFDIYYKTDASVVEAACPFSLEERKNVEKLEKQMNTTIKKELNKVLDKSQNEYKSDFIELGKVFMNHYPFEWRTIGPNWEDTFPSVAINIHIKSEIVDTVLLKKPTKESGSVLK
ncbi:Ger(x)C family spore germination protein [Neobacillus sp. 3P2-tot-E-2]|uniref:Ger(x)C family spore germination protein n=1 Tax=Neobacillus sp. 3P2-tot-E-2 TaxID=3132212 RepID=UPI0039A13823